MDVDEADILFAQKLADCDPAIRKKAFSKLRQWITARMRSEKGFERSELIVLWKGLYYCMWMQDKPLLHDELADRLCSLGDSFGIADQHILYIDTFLETISREWFQLDKWRVDKFMMVFRRFFRHALNWLKSESWSDEIWERLVDVYSKTVWAVDPDAYPEELKCHFASIYLDELDLAGVFKLESDKVFQFLDVYIKLLATRISGLFFRSIQNEIFDAILVDFAENAVPKQKKKMRGKKRVVLLDPAGSSEALQVDYGRIADAFLELGKSKSLNARRRKTIYKLAKQYRTAAGGENPFKETIEIEEDIGDDELDKAALELLKLNKTKGKKRRRKTEEISDHNDESEDDDISDQDDEVEEKPKKKQLKSKAIPSRRFKIKKTAHLRH